jgi:hypothetical protein
MIPESQARSERDAAELAREAAVKALAKLREDLEEVGKAKKRMQEIKDSVEEHRLYLVSNEDCDPYYWQGEACREAWSLWHEMAYSSAVNYHSALDALADELVDKEKDLKLKIQYQEGLIAGHVNNISALDYIIAWWRANREKGEN